jgi:phosphatidylserine/phosphatidylglycerophosphate/cardiolipin synthase-like enzyme
VNGSSALLLAADNPPSIPITSSQPVQIFLPLVSAPPPARLLIAAAHIDSAISGEPDEALLLWNVGVARQALAGWQVTVATRRAAFPLTGTLTLAPGQHLWCAATAVGFRTSFGHAPSCEWAADSDPAILNLDGKLSLANNGGRIQLWNAQHELIDTLLYGEEDQPADGWQGAPAQLYTRGGVAAAGQLWQRKLDPLTNQPLDSDQASDWSSDLADLAWGRRVRLPGWQGWEDDLGRPQSGAVTATVTVSIGPEGLYDALATVFNQAQTTIDLSLYTLEHPELTAVLVAAAQRGVQVRVLLEGSPPGGIDDLQKWCVAQLAAAGVEVRYAAVLASAPNGLRPRYRFVHAKYGLIDGQRAFVGTENPSHDAMPLPTTIPVGGRRGYYLMTDAAPVVAGLTRLFAADWAPDRFLDLHPFDPMHANYGGPPLDFVLPQVPIYPVAQAPFAAPMTVSGFARFAVISAPENALRPDEGLMALIHQAGAGDEIMLEQLYEHKHWGESASNPIADPNPRLQALIEAARRGARVRLILDSFFDEPDGLRSNQATVEYLHTVANREGLDLAARLGNPTAGGIHAKLVLIRLGEARWSAVGSLNGGETSHKLNREVVLLTDLASIYARLAEVFEWDWALAVELGAR